MPQKKTALVISAHAADFVWRCGGAIALHAEKGYDVTVVCLSFGERGESAKLWKEPGMTLEKVKSARRAEAEKAAVALGVRDLVCFDLGDYPLRLTDDDKYRLVDVIRAVQPAFMLSHSQYDPYNTDHMYATQVALETRDENSAWLRAWDDYEFHSLKLTRHHTTGVGHIAYRTSSPEALERRVKAIEASGYTVIGWVEGDRGHGRAFRFEDPFGHVFEIYWDTVRYSPEGADVPALKNTASAFTGAAPRRIDHLNLLSGDVTEFRRFMETCLGSRVTEIIRLDNGRIGGCWFTVNNKTYDLACTEEHGGGHGRLHHVTYATDQREDILRAADIFLQNGVHIETGPHKHAVQGTFFLYVWEPAGNRVELANSGARLILAPDWEPVVWTQAERMKGQAWGLKTIETFHTHGTPPVQGKEH